RLLESHSRDLLGPNPVRRTVRIMVTLPSDAEADYTLIDSLVQHGMDVARINCAHDGPAAWERMIGHIRRAGKKRGRVCRVLMDLGGPKLRTGPVEPGPAVLRLRPSRNAFGSVVHPARIWIYPDEKPYCPPTPADASLPASAAWISRLSVGDRIRFTDARGAHRQMTLVDIAYDGCWAEINDTAYITPGMSVSRCKGRSATDDDVTVIGNFPLMQGPIDLAVGDLLVLTREMLPGRPATRDSSGKVLTPASIASTLPEIFNDVQAGEHIW